MLIEALAAGLGVSLLAVAGLVWRLTTLVRRHGRCREALERVRDERDGLQLRVAALTCRDPNVIRFPRRGLN